MRVFDILNAVRRLEHGTLTLAERHMLVILGSYLNNNTGECYPSWATLANATGMDRRTVARVLSTLEAKGIITARRTKLSSRYLFHMGALEAMARADSPPETASASETGGGDRMPPPGDPTPPGGDRMPPPGDPTPPPLVIVRHQTDDPTPPKQSLNRSLNERSEQSKGFALAPPSTEVKKTKSQRTAEELFAYYVSERERHKLPGTGNCKLTKSIVRGVEKFVKETGDDLPTCKRVIRGMLLDDWRREQGTALLAMHYAFRVDQRDKYLALADEDDVIQAREEMYRQRERERAQAEAARGPLGPPPPAVQKQLEKLMGSSWGASDQIQRARAQVMSIGQRERDELRELSGEGAPVSWQPKTTARHEPHADLEAPAPATDDDSARATPAAMADALTRAKAQIAAQNREADELVAFAARATQGRAT